MWNYICIRWLINWSDCKKSFQAKTWENASRYDWPGPSASRFKYVVRENNRSRKATDHMRSWIYLRPNLLFAFHCIIWRFVRNVTTVTEWRSGPSGTSSNSKCQMEWKVSSISVCRRHVLKKEAEVILQYEDLRLKFGAQGMWKQKWYQ